jgi:hypothetical protein
MSASMRASETSIRLDHIGDTDVSFSNISDEPLDSIRTHE